MLRHLDFTKNVCEIYCNFLFALESPHYLITLFHMGIPLCFIINQDEKNQMMTTNVWVKQVLFHK